MITERAEKRINIYLTAEETGVVQNGQTIVDRSNVFMEGAKVEVLPLRTVEPDDSLKDRYSVDRLRIACSAPLKGNLFGNGDFQVIIPAITLTDVRLVGVHIQKNEILTPVASDRDALVEHVIPEDGVYVYFGGSLQTVDTAAFYYHAG